MFYLLEVEDYVRVEPKHFGLATKEAIESQLNESYVNNFNKEFGYIISVVSVDKIEEGVLILLHGGLNCMSLFMEQLMK